MLRILIWFILVWLVISSKKNRNPYWSVGSTLVKNEVKVDIFWHCCEDRSNLMISTRTICNQHPEKVSLQPIFIRSTSRCSQRLLGSSQKLFSHFNISIFPKNNTKNCTDEHLYFSCKLCHLFWKYSYSFKVTILHLIFINVSKLLFGRVGFYVQIPNNLLLKLA